MIQIHRLQDASDLKALAILKQGLKQIVGRDDSILQENYSPDRTDHPANIFNVLKEGRFSIGAYYVIEDDGKFIASSGWNRYDESTALVMVRSYVSPEYRNEFMMGKLLLPIMIEETKDYEKVWITCDEFNKTIYHWFVRASQGKARLNWPEIYSRFEPIGKRLVNYTEQYVAQLKK